MASTEHLTIEELEAGLEHVGRSPKDESVLTLIVLRPQTDAREVIEEAELSLTEGLVGDNWRARGSRTMVDGGPDPERQVTIVNARVAALVAGERERWPLAGDQLFVDLDLSRENLPPGTRLAIGAALLEVTEPPHTGCRKYAARFGSDALKFVSTPTGRAMNLRGVHAKVVRPGVIRTGDVVRKA
jgi:MOSC domain-containing protein YiiM